ncbi:MAG TPA: EAL domain-containing protein, partial [Mycobacteriales bacterium]|nr:EAL domain-containing protein [Mycobacteriales bacterium]
VRDVTDRHRAEDELLRLALHDPLTGLANRALLADRATLALSRRGRGAVALFLLDLDRFKMVNDTLGHHAGDELLLGVAQRLALAARPSDTVARVGGDEFVVLCEDLADAEQAAEIAARLLTAVRDPISLLAGSERVEVRTSIGIAACPRGESTAVGELLRRADLALYRAKQAGRDRFAMFDEELHSQALARMKTEQALRRALGESGLRVHYQPILLLSDDRVTAAEALIRMHDPSGRPVAAAEFIEIAEDSGTITEIDCFVLEDTLRHLDRWPSTLGLDWVAVNVAARTMAYPGLLTRIGTAILSSPDVCQHLVFELTERTLLDTETGARAAVDAVRELGVSLAVDDFGTGYSALSYLQTLPLRIVKLDKALIAETVRTARAAAVAAAMVDLAHAIGLLVVAEGVERPDELAMVRRLGCDYAQGYLIGRPAPADAFAASVR